MTRTSAFREDRKTTSPKTVTPTGAGMKTSKRIVPVHIGLGEESHPDGTVRTIDREILIMVDSIDHDEDVEQDEYERHTDKVFSDRLARYERSARAVRMW